MDHRSSAREILSAIGGKENLVSAAHCATRLRLIIADNSKIQKDTLENIDVVKGVFEASGQLQIIIGTGTVTRSMTNLSQRQAWKPLQRTKSRLRWLRSRTGSKDLSKLLATYSYL